MSLEDTLKSMKEFDISEFDVNDIDFNNIGDWPLPGRLLIWIIVFLAVLYASFHFNLRDMHAQWTAAEAEELTLKEEFEKKVNEAANLEAYRAQIVEMDESFEALLKQLPQDTEVPGLLEDISTKGLDSGLTFNTIDLKPENPQEFYIELPISINVTGGYHDFGSFVSGIAGLPRIVTLHDFEIDPMKNEGGQGMLEMTIIAKTYRYKATEE